MPYIYLTSRVSSPWCLAAKICLTGTSLHSWQSGQEEGSLVPRGCWKCHQRDVSGISDLSLQWSFSPFLSSCKDLGVLPSVTIVTCLWQNGTDLRGT